MMAAAVALLVVAGCSGGPPAGGGGGADADGRAGPERAVTVPVAHDPPADFAAAVALRDPGGAPLPVVRTLDGTLGWAVTADGLTRVDLPSRTASAQARPGAPLVLDPTQPPGAFGSLVGPAVATDLPAAPGVSGPGRGAVAAFPVRTPGVGTTEPAPQIAVVTAYAATGEAAASGLVAVTGSATQTPDRLRTAVVGVAGRVAVVTADNEFGAFTAGVDLTSGRTVWTGPPGFLASLVAGDTVLGTAARGAYVRDGPTTLLAVDVATGARRWGSPDGGRIQQAGPALALVTGTVYATGRRFARLLDTRDGHLVRAISNGSAERCYYDEQAVTVCSSGGGTDRSAFAIDADTGALLWSLPDMPDPAAGRAAPEVTAAWHGAVYGVTPNGPVVLDGRTGQDRTSTATAAPTLVNAYYGITTSGPPGPIDFTRPLAGELLAAPTT